jgi:hypothetical protein
MNAPADTCRLRLSAGPRAGRMVADLFDRLARHAGDMGWTLLAGQVGDDGTAWADIRPADQTPPRRRIPLTPDADPLGLLTRILFQPLRPADRPGDIPPALLAVGSDPALTPAAMIWRACMTGRPLPGWLVGLGIASSPGPDPAALLLCPLLLAATGHLPGGGGAMGAATAERLLSRLLGATDTLVRAGGRIMPAIAVPAMLVRAVIGTDGVLPPTAVQVDTAISA